MQLIKAGAPPHDVGKIGIADAILLNPAQLTPEEFRVMTTHTTIGGQILSGSQSPLLQLAEKIALTHHECWDGRGYPLGFGEKTFRLPAGSLPSPTYSMTRRIERPYKKSWPAADAVAETRELGGTKFYQRSRESILCSCSGMDFSAGTIRSMSFSHTRGSVILLSELSLGGK